MLLARSLASRVRARAAQSFRSVSSDAKAPLYSERMDKTGRPISPHLMIYRLPAIAWSSVMVRITGAVASAGFFGLGGATLFGGGPWAVDTAQMISEAVSPMAAKFSVAFVLSYQWFGSVRHAYWDLTAKGFNNKSMLHGAYAMWATTLGLSAALMFYALPPFSKDEKAKRS